MPEPILTIGDLEPERPTVRINHVEPDGLLERLKDRYLDVLLRRWPVRYTRRSDLFALRHPSEFGIRDIARISNAQRAIAALRDGEVDEALERRVGRLLREVSGLVLEAPASVLDQLSPTQHIQVLVAFNASALGQMPTPTPKAASTENPSTSAGSSPASAASTTATAGRTG